MKIKVSDYIANFLVANNITNLFSVVGGGSMHLNDSFASTKDINIIYNHHEQAAAIAAESYARVTNKLAAVCVTSGPGATNALTGCLCGYMGSIPMLFFSGQVRYPLTVRSTGLDLRTNGEQEYDICRSVSGMTKYCEMIIDPMKIKYCLEKATYIATHGRSGPCWLDIPLDVQSALVDEDWLTGFDQASHFSINVPEVSNDTIQLILSKIKNAKRPVLYAGFGVRLADAHKEFLELVDLLNIPVTTGMTSVDYITNDHPLYAGRPGITGDRAGNFAVQNSDLFFSIGSRLSYKQTGYNTDTWARGAYKIVSDIDEQELKREHLRIDLPVNADAKDLIVKLIYELKQSKYPISNQKDWIEQCNTWVKKYPVVTDTHYRVTDKKASIYVFYKMLSKIMKENDIIIVSAGNARVVARQAIEIKKGQRLISNPSTSPTGYCLPGAIGACIANNKNSVLVVTGEGSVQMNIQELQTIKQNNLPIKIIVINNGGYHSIRITQKSFFENHNHAGIGEESGDLSFPDMSKIACAYGFKYFECHNNEDLEEELINFYEYPSYCICQIFVTTTQSITPKAASKVLANGTMYSAPLEDMSPFLSEEELFQNMYIPLIDESL